jgi:hypothetical protein
MGIFSRERVKVQACLRSRRDKRRRSRKKKEVLTKDVEGQAAGATALVAAAWPGMKPARVAVRAPVVSPPRRQMLHELDDNVLVGHVAHETEERGGLAVAVVGPADVVELHGLVDQKSLVDLWSIRTPP